MSSWVSEVSTLLTIDEKTETIADVAEVSLIASLVPIRAAVQPTSTLLTKAEIAALVATCV